MVMVVVRQEAYPLPVRRYQSYAFRSLRAEALCPIPMPRLAPQHRALPTPPATRGKP